jgi:hypothetical protein
VSLLTTAATAAYRYSSRKPLSFHALRPERTVKSSGFAVSDTHALCIKDEVLIDTARVSGLDVMYSLNLLTMGVAEPVAECQPRICDGRKPDIEKQNRTFK